MSKYTDMMRVQQGWKLHLANCERDAGNDNAALELEAKAADWWAMREAWELLTESACTVVEQYEGLGVRLEAMARLKHALTKARGE